jgi:hypothetical protein
MIQDPHKEAEVIEVVIVAKVHTEEEEGGSKVAANINTMAVGTKLMEAGAGADQDTMEIETHGGRVMAHSNSNTNQITRRIEISLQTSSHVIDVAQRSYKKSLQSTCTPS